MITENDDVILQVVLPMLADARMTHSNKPLRYCYACLSEQPIEVKYQRVADTFIGQVACAACLRPMLAFEHELLGS